MARSAVEPPVVRRTRAFYEWEIRGRGWLRFPYFVPLEPAFEPFLGVPPIPAPQIDDARRHTLLSGFLARLKSEDSSPADEEEHEELLPEEVVPAEELSEYQIILPQDARVSPEVVSRWLATLSTCEALSFEIIGVDGEVRVSVAGAPADARIALDYLESFLPEVEVVETTGALESAWDGALGPYFSVVEFGLARECMLPLSGSGRFAPDPLTPLIGALGSLASGEFGALQVLFEPVRAPWAESILRSVVTPSGQPFFADAPEITRFAREKVSTPLAAAVVRLAGKARSEEATWEVMRRLVGSLSQFGSPETNELIPLPGDAEVLEDDFLARTTHRSGMLLSVAELSAIVHPPSENVVVPALVRAVRRSKVVPEELTGGGLSLGENLHRGEVREVLLPEEARLRHLHVVGASGTGKSTLLVQMILADIEAGRGVGVLDPHGDLIDEVLARMGDERRADVVLFDPADEAYRVGWNILGAESELERELLASDLVAVFRRLSTSWGDQMTSVLSNAVLVFLDSREGGSLLDLRQFLVDETFRKRFLQTVRDPYLRSWWETEFLLLVGRKPQAPILTRLDTFLRSKRIRDLVTVRRGLDFRAIVDSGKIFFAKLSQGAIGVENAALLGSLLVSKLHQVTLARQEQAERDRRPFFLYLDEFHEVATPSMATLFSGVRKYRLGLVVAHQDLHQLHSKAPDVERSVLANAHTRICFRLGDDDARTLGKGFGFFTPEDLMALSIGEAICRVGGRDNDFNLRTRALEAIDPTEAGRRREVIRRASGERWGSMKDEEPQARAEVPPREQADSERTQAQQPARPQPTPPVVAGASKPLQLTKEALDYLELVAVDPFLSVRERNAALGVSAWKGQQIKTTLLEAALVREVAVNPGGRGERFLLLELTADGRSLLGTYGITPSTGHGRGGVAHQWWTKTIAEWLTEQGIAAEVEDDSRGARVDLAFTVGGERVAVEVETSEGHVIENIRKDREAGYSVVVSLVDDADALGRVEKRLQQELGEAAEGVLLADLRDYQQILAKLLPSSSASLRPPNQNEERGGRGRRKRQRRVSQPVQAPLLGEAGAFTTPLAAEYLGLSPATLETQRVRGGGPTFVKLGRRVVYRKEDLDAWLEERRRRSTSDPG